MQPRRNVGGWFFQTIQTMGLDAVRKDQGDHLVFWAGTYFDTSTAVPWFMYTSCKDGCYEIGNGERKRDKVSVE